MIRVEITAVGRGLYEYRLSLRGRALSGKSRQPLLDACRQIKSLLGESGDGERVGLFNPGSADCRLSCLVGWGAAHRVKETRRQGPTLASYEDPEALRARLQPKRRVG